MPGPLPNTQFIQARVRHCREIKLLCFSSPSNLTLATSVAVVLRSDSFCDDVTDSCELE